MTHPHPAPSRRPATSPAFRRLARALLCATLIASVAGCEALGIIAAKVGPPPTVHPKYAGLGNQTVGVMVWADTGVEIDFPSIQLDVGSSFQKKLADALAADPKKQKHLSGMKFPYPAASFVRYQEEHPEIQGLAATEIAARLGVSRLIYVEIERFQTRSDSAVELYRGELVASVKVIEVTDGKGKIAYEESSVDAVFPPKAPAEGVPSSNDLKIYRGLVGEFTTVLAKKFIAYQEDF